MDCYLCGASNSPDADVCSRCDGQLLKIGLDAEFDAEVDPEVDKVSEADTDVDVDAHSVAGDDEETPEPKKRRRSRMMSVEDTRLEDALGMGTTHGADSDDEYEPLLIPKAGPSANIPMIGTSRPVGTSGGVVEERSGRTSYVLLGMLFAAVLWMAYSTLAASRDDVPENLALTNTTLPVDTTPTTEPRPRPWSSAEVGGRFGPAFVRITFIDCGVPESEGLPTPILEEREVYGITVNEHSVIAPSAALGTADLATIRSRFGNRAHARISEPDSGIIAITTDRSLNRTLGLVDTPLGDPTYYVSYDDEFATTTVTTESSDIAIEITVTDQGEAVAVRLDSSAADLDLLHEIATFRTEIQENPTPIRGATICDDLPYIIDATPTETATTEEDN